METTNMNTITKTGTLVCAAFAVICMAMAAEPKVQPPVEEVFLTRANDIAAGKIEYLGAATFPWNPDLTTNAVRGAKLAKSIDDILSKADAIFNVYVHNQQKLFPKTYAKYLKSIEGEYPIVSRVLSGDAPAPVKTDKNYIKYIIERERFEVGQIYIPGLAAGRVGGIAKSIQDASVYVVRRGLRKAGKSFVAKEKLDASGKVMKDSKGAPIMTNPTKEYMDEITACLNAPYFNGLEAALKKVGVEDEDMPKLSDLREKADKVVNALQEKILNGEIEFSGEFAYYLRFKLGVTEYNKFVKLYNDGE